MTWFRFKLWSIDRELGLGREGLAEALARAQEMYSNRSSGARGLELAAVGLAGASWILLCILGLRAATTWPDHWALLLMIPLCLIPAIIAPVIVRWRYRSYIHRALREQGYELCMRCHYWHRGLDDRVTKCPECGTTREVNPGMSREAER